MRRDYHYENGLHLITNGKRGYGEAHKIYLGKKAIDIGEGGEYQHSVAPDVGAQEIKTYIDDCPEKVRAVIEKVGKSNCCSIYDLYSFDEFKTLVENFED